MLYIQFFLASLILAVSPGPDNLYVLNQSIARGAKAGVTITLGLCTGLLVQSSLVAIGVAQALQQLQWLWWSLACFGAGYLAYLAWDSWCSASPALPIEAYPKQENSRQPLAIMCFWRDYRRGVLMNLSNPKVLLFFMAFLPQFVDLHRPLAPQVFTLGSLFILASLLVFCTIAVLGEQLARRVLERPDVVRLINKLAALVLAGLALRLLWFGVTTAV